MVARRSPPFLSALNKCRRPLVGTFPSSPSPSQGGTISQKSSNENSSSCELNKIVSPFQEVTGNRYFYPSSRKPGQRNRNKKRSSRILVPPTGMHVSSPSLPPIVAASTIPAYIHVKTTTVGATIPRQVVPLQDDDDRNAEASPRSNRNLREQEEVDKTLDDASSISLPDSLWNISANDEDDDDEDDSMWAEFHQELADELQIVDCPSDEDRMVTPSLLVSPHLYEKNAAC